MQTQNPILLSQTPPTGWRMTVTAEAGGLGGYMLMGQSGPVVMLEISIDGGQVWDEIAFPHTLAPGELLRMTRLDPSGELTTIHALAPVVEDQPPDGQADPYATTSDTGGYQTITNATFTADGEGYQTLPDATPTADPDGYESVERTS